MLLKKEYIFTEDPFGYFHRKIVVFVPLMILPGVLVLSLIFLFNTEYTYIFLSLFLVSTVISVVLIFVISSINFFKMKEDSFNKSFSLKEKWIAFEDVKNVMISKPDQKKRSNVIFNLLNADETIKVRNLSENDIIKLQLIFRNKKIPTKKQ